MERNGKDPQQPIQENLRLVELNGNKPALQLNGHSAHHTNGVADTHHRRQSSTEEPTFISVSERGFSSSPIAKKSTTVVAPLSLTDEVASPAPPPSSLLLYNITDKPPWHLAILLGLQHFLLFFGGIVSLPLLLRKPLLPIVQGGTFSFLGPSLSILALPQWQCPNETTIDAMEYDDRQELWQSRMREIQGAIIMSSVFEVFIGFSGAIGFLMRFIGPLTIVPTIALTAVVLSWTLCAILTAAGALSDDVDSYSYQARTDIKLETLDVTPWARFPYPFQVTAPD
ncbi:hypothetical protein BV898_13995 [Hypsibius exemplaris]|uniref:Solute carrier family 23 member 2 n=1 Tax=Hypsibius exemplaris TaxID=2072580 RepID=A0A1W0W947_HYPEX|nr:hypothetical protein BV898_13995 [Hypsibius exemplaris]